MYYWRLCILLTFRSICCTPLQDHMEQFCVLVWTESQGVQYTQFSTIIKKQKEVIIRWLIDRKQSEIRKVHPRLSCFNKGVRRIEIQDIPGISECLCFLGMFNVMFNILDWEFMMLSIFMILLCKTCRYLSGYYNKRKPILLLEN